MTTTDDHTLVQHTLRTQSNLWRILVELVRQLSPDTHSQVTLGIDTRSVRGHI